jgi:signal transduction histidine kinase
MNIRITHLMFAFILCLKTLSAIGQESTYGYIHFKEGLPVKATGQVLISYKENFDETPQISDWIPFTDSLAIVDEIIYFSRGPFWLLIPVENTSDSTYSLAVKIFSNYSRVMLKSNSTDSVYFFRLQQSTFDDYVPGSYFPAAPLTFSPGVDTVLIYCEPITNYKAALHRVIFDYTDDVSGDWVKHVSRSGSFIFILFTFVSFIAFQIFYIIIQYFYHRKREYIEYFFYLICIFIYFSVRLEHMMRIDILTGSVIGLRPYLNDMMMLLPYVFYMRFGRFFIGMKQNYPRMNTQIKYFEGVLIILIIAVTFFSAIGHSFFSREVMLIIGIALFSYTTYLVGYFFIRRNKLINFLLAGSLCAITGSFISTVLSVLPLYIDIEVIAPLIFSMIGITFEIFFFNTGLGYKAKYEQEEKIVAQQKLIQENERNQLISKEMQNIRDNIANDLHDDVGSTLGSISLYSEIANNTLDKDPAATKSILKKITVSSQKMLESMNDIIWSIHTRRDDNQKLVDRMKQFVADRITPMGIQFDLSLDEEVKKLNFSMEARRTLLLFFKEAVNNAAKYSDTKNVTCTMQVADGILIISIKDFGKGFNTSEVRNGNGMKTMSERISALNGSFLITSEPGDGTVIIAEIKVKDVEAV